MGGIHDILDSIYSSSDQDFLATIVHVEGSAYRKEGTSMLFKGNGTQIGLLSAGCLETDLYYQVQELRKQSNSKTLIYDMREEKDFTWGQGAGCNGVIRILLEPVDSCIRDHLCKLRYHLDGGNHVTMIKKFEDDGSVSDYLCMADAQCVYGKWNGGVPAIVQRILGELHQEVQKSGIRFYPELSAKLYIHTFQPKPRLIVFGAGEDAVPLVKIASQSGFSVTVSDWREERCRESYFPDADRLILGFPSEVIPLVNFSHHDSVVILTHNFQRDKELLNLLENQELRYLGILGPYKRLQRLLEEKTIPSKINSPAGLAIGADGPDEIAVSIVAELIQFQRFNKMYEKVKTHER